MTKREIEERLERIRSVGNGDPEYAHVEQDKLLVDVLQAIADRRIIGEGCEEAAALALKVKDIDFARWYA